MTREKAIEWFEFLKKGFVNTEYEEYLNLAITALSVQNVPSAIEDIKKERYNQGFVDGYKNSYDRGHSVIEDIKAEIMSYRDSVDRAISEDEFKRDGMKIAYQDCIEIIDKHIGKAESEDK